jgi:hypothetical protein
MSQRKLIVSLTIAILLAVTAGVSQASLSRMEGMGLDVPLLSQFPDVGRPAEQPRARRAGPEPE